jgi:RHS repeat-associated protein
MADVSARNIKIEHAAQQGKKGAEQASQSTVGKAISTTGAAMGVYGQVMGFTGQLSEKALMPVFQALSFMQGIACLPASSHLDPVIGIDVHMVIIPPSPSPIPMPHPYIAVVMDPKDWLSCAAMTVAAMAAPTPTGNADADAAASLAFSVGTMALTMAGMSATVKLGGFTPRTVSGVKNKVVPHFPMGSSFALPTKKNEGHAQLGSLFLVADSCPFTGMLHLNNNCWDVGVMQLMRKQYKPAPGQLFMPTGFIMAIPSHNVIVNPVPTPVNPIAAFTKLLNAGFAKILHKVAGKLPPGIRNAVDKAICHVTGHPVDVVSGMLFTDEEDFALPGVIPLSWERTWYSDSSYKGPLGHGWYHKYDMGFLVDEKNNQAIFRMNDGRGVIFELPQPGQFTFDRNEKLFLHCHADEKFYYITDRDGLMYRFSEQAYTDRQARTGYRLLKSLSNANGYAIRLDYGHAGNLEKVTDSAGRVLAVESDAEGRITAIMAPHPSGQGDAFPIARYTYDDAGNMICHTDALDQQMTFEYENHLLVKETWRNGHQWFFRYDGSSTGARCIHTWGDGDIYNHKLAYTTGCTVVENSLGHKTTYYHKNGLPYIKIDGNGAEWQYRYNRFNELEWETDPMGNQQNYSHDEWGNVITATDAAGGFSSTEYYHPKFPLLPTEAMDAAGGRWKWEYDELGNLIRRVNSLGAKTEYTYEDGLLIRMLNATGAVSKLGYDNEQNLARIQTDDGALTEYVYDALGNCRAVTNPYGLRQRRTFDLKGRVVRVNEFDGNVIDVEYDGIDNIIKYKDRQTEVLYTYRGLWKLTSRTEAGATLVFKYDTEEQIRKVINEHGQAYRFEMDAAGNVIEEIGFDDIARRFERNAAGWVTRVLRPGGKFTQYGYDACRRITEVIYSDGEKETYAYRPDGEVMQALNASAKVQFDRNVMGDVLKETVNGEWIVSEYDITGNRIKTLSSLGANISSRYNKMGDVSGMEANGWQTMFEHDKLGFEIRRLLPGGITNEWQRDGTGRPVVQTVGHTAGNVFSTRLKKHYQWEVNDRLKQIKDEKGVTKFEHDAWSNLSRTVYPNGEEQLRNPDAIGNLFKTTDRKDRVYSKGGQLRKADGWEYIYDAEGNLVEKKHIGGDVWRYEWNDAGMLAKVIRPDKTEVTFGYDVFGRRLWKRFRNTITKFVWDGNVLLHEWKENAIESPTLGKTAVDVDRLITWIFKTNCFAPSAKIKGNKQYSIVADHLGTPVQMYKDGSALLWDCDLDSFGKIRMEKGEHGSCPFRYQGQYDDAETGLYYNRFRYYAPDEGVYLSKDPIGLRSGEPNLYRYVADPNVWIDFFGLAPGYHGNDRRSPKAQHGYVIRDSRGRVVKTGVSDGRIRRDGKSSRAEKQVRALNSDPTRAAHQPYTSEVVKNIPTQPDARGKIYDWEVQNAQANRGTLDPTIHQRP